MSSASAIPSVEDRPSGAARGDTSDSGPGFKTSVPPARDPLSILIVVPALDAGAADVGAVELVRILAAAGHRAIVVSQPGRLVADVTAAGGEFVTLDMASHNPLRMLRNTAALSRLARERNCDVIHAHGRARGLERLFRRAADAAFRS